MEKILREVLAEDKNILARRNDLISALDKKVPPELKRKYASIKKALELNVGEVFAIGEEDHEAAKLRAAQILKDSGMQEARVNLVVETFVKALGWDKPLIEVEPEPALKPLPKKSVEEISNKAKVEVPPPVKIEKTKVEAPPPPVEVEPIEVESPVKKMFAKATPKVEELLNRGRKISQTAAPVTNANVPPRNTGNFMGEYNALADKNGIELRNARAEFFQRYQVRTFSCVNADAHVKTLAPPPDFRDRDGGDFWAIPSALFSSMANENTYVVYPNVAIRQYTPNHHSERALGEVFDSNFANGNTYSKIRVEQFAVFTCSGNVWTLFRKGKLRLE